MSVSELAGLSVVAPAILWLACMRLRMTEIAMHAA